MSMQPQLPQPKGPPKGATARIEITVDDKGMCFIGMSQMDLVLFWGLLKAAEKTLDGNMGRPDYIIQLKPPIVLPNPEQVAAVASPFSG